MRLTFSDSEPLPLPELEVPPVPVDPLFPESPDDDELEPEPLSEPDELPDEDEPEPEPDELPEPLPDEELPPDEPPVSVPEDELEPLPEESPFPEDEPPLELPSDELLPEEEEPSTVTSSLELPSSLHPENENAKNSAAKTAEILANFFIISSLLIKLEIAN